MAFHKTRPNITAETILFVCYNSIKNVVEISNLSIVINQRFPSQQTKVANIEDIICYFAS